MSQETDSWKGVEWRQEQCVLKATEQKELNREKDAMVKVQKVTAEDILESEFTGF